ncbi:transcription initiation factor IID, 18kD subunit-domain-containing protein [Mycena sp. CBHHK59/15]|nr:transcription initiation factor IID, 18kD subunit-domain-containing protein [Mycena sp. CBHHK59/15]
MAARKGAVFDTGNVIREYKYTQEISQMMFVFGAVQDPNSEAANLVEDIVCVQIIELHALATRRGTRYLSPEDLIFFIRHDRGKVNRLRTYLSWKDMRKHAKDSGGGGGGGGVEVETIEDGGDEKLTTKAQETTIKLPWEITTIYSESDDEEDEDDIEAHEASILRLKEADDATRQMTREVSALFRLPKSVVHVPESKNASASSSTSPTHLGLKAGDDIMVRSLTLTGLTVKKSLEDSHPREEYASPSLGKRKALGGGAGAAEKRWCEDSPERDAEASLPVNTLFLPPPEARTALRPEHIQDAFSRMQMELVHLRFAGSHNWRGGLVRTRVSSSDDIRDVNLMDL